MLSWRLLEFERASRLSWHAWLHRAHVCQLTAYSALGSAAMRPGSEEPAAGLRKRRHQLRPAARAASARWASPAAQPFSRRGNLNFRPGPNARSASETSWRPTADATRTACAPDSPSSVGRETPPSSESPAGFLDENGCGLQRDELREKLRRQRKKRAKS